MKRLFLNTTARMRARLAFFISPEAKEQRDIARRQAETDELTGLGNRAAFNRATQRALIEVQQFIFFDVSNFKKYQDTLGSHEAGDAFLKAVATSLALTAREFNCSRVFRFGGDEFVIICPPAVAIELRKAAEKNAGLRIINGNTPIFIVGGIGYSVDAASRAMYARKAVFKDQFLLDCGREHQYAIQYPQAV